LKIATFALLFLAPYDAALCEIAIVYDWCCYIIGLIALLLFCRSFNFWC